MGISDDIKPRRIYKYVSKKNDAKSFDSVDHSEKVKIEQKSLNEDESQHDYDKVNNTESKARIEDEFFNEDYRDNIHTKQSKRFNFPFKLISWLIVIIFIVVSLYKNFDQIIKIIDNKLNIIPTESSEQSDTDTYTNTESSTTSPTTETGQGTATTTTPTTTPTTPEIVKSTIKMEVLNGNGISGSADKVAATLRNNGFTVSRVANAKVFSYSKTYIYYRTGAESYMTLVKTFLSDRVCTSEKSDSITTGYDLVVVVGKQ